MKTTQNHTEPLDESKEPLPEILFPQQVCAVLKIHINTFWKLANAGDIPAKKVGGRWRVNRQELIDYMRTQTVQGLPPAHPEQTAA